MAVGMFDAGEHAFLGQVVERVDAQVITNLFDGPRIGD